jgi:hypothetical protein
VPAVKEVIGVVVGHSQRGETGVPEQKALHSLDKEDLLQNTPHSIHEQNRYRQAERLKVEHETQ